MSLEIGYAYTFMLVCADTELTEHKIMCDFHWFLSNSNSNERDFTYHVYPGKTILDYTKCIIKTITCY